MSSESETDIRVPIASDADLVVARRKGRELATRLGFSSSDLTLIATGISELARNIISYAKRGEISLGIVKDRHGQGILVEARDDGPGIPDIVRAMQDGYSTSGGLGLGLSGVKRLMDDFEIVSQSGQGTTIKVKKWRR